MPSRRQPAQPLVIGHRGASGYRPEHTLAAYELVARLGADVLEPDLVATKDHVLVARHENEISETTDVAEHPELADRRTTKVVDGVRCTGWFTEDLTLAELRTLRVRERLPGLRPGNTVYDGRYPVPTLGEILALRARLSRELRRPIGVYPETKLPAHFRALGLPLEPVLAHSLRARRLDHYWSPVHVQSFDAASLHELRRLGLRSRLVQLTRSGEPRLTSPPGLREVASYADGIGPDKTSVIPRDAEGRLGTPTDLVADAHAAGLVVHAYTFRAENAFLPSDHRDGDDPATHGRAVDEQVAHLRAGVDGIFTDHPDIGVRAREAARQGHAPSTSRRRRAGSRR